MIARLVEPRSGLSGRVRAPQSYDYRNLRSETGGFCITENPRFKH